MATRAEHRRRVARPQRLLVIGVGNRDRGDDAAGPAVCDLLDAADPDGIATVVCEGSVVDLAAIWERDDQVVVVDAAEPAGRPGRVREIDGASRLLAPAGAISTHTIDVPTAIGLARAIGRLPAGLTVLAIEAARFDDGAALTPEVEAAVSDVAATIIRRAGRRAG